jgi:hypothetical protein
MRILASFYVAFLVYVGWCSVRSSAQAHSWRATVLETVTSVGWPLLVAAFFWPSLARSLGRAAAPLFVVIGAWTLYTVWRDCRPSVSKAKMPAEIPLAHRNVAYTISAAMCALIVIPVFILGAAVAARALAPTV